MKKTVVFRMFLTFFIIMSVCYLKPGSHNSALSQQAGPVISNDQLVQSMLTVNSYRRKIVTVTTYAGQPDRSKTFEDAYIKNPLSVSSRQIISSGEAYDEWIVIGGTRWGRMAKDGTWESFAPGDWDTDPPLSFKYDLQTLSYSIEYRLLQYRKTGSEKVNGVNCIRYAVSGSYEDSVSIGRRSSDRYPITLSAEGSIWIADDPVVRNAIIRQRLKVHSDILADTARNKHIVSDETIEDDVLDVNSTVIRPPTTP